MTRESNTIALGQEYKSEKPGEVFFARFFRSKPDVPGESHNILRQILGDESQIFARDLTEAVAFADARGLGEIVESSGYTDPPTLLASEWAEAGLWPEALHAACWLGYIAMKARACDIDELLGDHGIIHQLAHVNQRKAELNARAETVAKIKDKLPGWLRSLESRVPGFTRTTPFDVQAAIKAHLTAPARLRAIKRRGVVLQDESMDKRQERVERVNRAA